MPPRRLPRSWLADRLRSAAGAVQRLAGRVDPTEATGQLLTLRPTDAPRAAPRRFGEPPRHWLDLVAAHAPGLLRELDLDASRAGPAEARSGDGPDGHDDPSVLADAAANAAGPGGPPHRFTADAADGQGSTGFPGGDGFDRRTPGGGDRGRGAGGGRGDTGAASGTGNTGATDRSTAPRATDGPGSRDGGGDLFGGGRTRPTGTSDHAGAPGAADRPGAGRVLGAPGTPTVPHAPPVRRGAGSTTGPGVSTVPDAPAPAAVSAWPPAPGPAATTGPARPAGSGAPLRPGESARRHIPNRAGQNGTDRGGTGPAGVTPALPMVRPAVPGPPVPAWEPDRPHRRPAHPAPIPRAERSVDDVGPSRDGLPPRSAAASDGYPDGRAGLTGGTVSTGGPSRGRARGVADGPALVTRPARAGSVPNAGPPDLARTAGRGPWPALPDEPAWSGNLAGGPDPGTGGAGAVGGGRAHAADRWPALPDDGPLWTVPGAALDAARLARLDREQAGG